MPQPQSQRGLIDTFLREERLPPDFRETISRWYLPLAEDLLKKANAQPAPLIVGINGAQGTGKSTLAKFLALILGLRHVSTATLSLDDFYLDRERRNILAQAVHPLLATRGVPGTHDLTLARRVLQDLTRPDEQVVWLPRFDKGADEPLPTGEWPQISAPVDLIILEGWFLGAQSQPLSALQKPVNELEAAEDHDGRWRGYVNRELEHYQDIFNAIDWLVMLRAPSFDSVYQWRALQEEKLGSRGGGANAPRVMSAAELRRFVQHFERLTRHCLHSIPPRADVLFHLNPQHAVTAKE
ncbi:MAG: hypothetical protein WDZ76_09270 [Pseudohongiellaceae bacterium]